MAVPDPNKYLKSSTPSNMPVPKSSGVVPSPTSAKSVSASGLGVITPSQTKVPNPNTASTLTKNTGLTPIVATKNTVPKPPTQPQTFSSPQYTDWQAKTNENYANLEKLVNTPFSYDPETDPAYQAQRKLAQLRAGDATRSALETANDRGILGSSMNITQLGEIQQRAEQEAAAYIPEYRNQAYGQYQDRLANAGKLLGESRNIRGDQFNEGYQEAALTGSYKSPELKNLEQQLVNYKDQTEKNWANMTAEQKAAAKAEGNRLRSQIDSLGGNSGLFGADVGAGTARGNMAQSGIRTLPGQQLDQGMRIDNWGAYMDIVGQTGNLGQGPQSNWGNLINQAGTGKNTLAGDNNQFSQGVTMAQLTGYLPDGSPTSAQQQQLLANEWTVADQTGTITKTLAQMYGIPEGTPTRAAMEFAQQIAVSRQNANTSAYSAQTSRMNANNSQLMDIWKATGVAPAGINGVAQGTPYATGSNTSSPDYNYQDDPSFAEGIAWVNEDPVKALEDIRKGSANFIDRFGYKGYQEILKAAQSQIPKDNTNPVIAEALKKSK